MPNPKEGKDSGPDAEEDTGPTPRGQKEEEDVPNHKDAGPAPKSIRAQYELVNQA